MLTLAASAHAGAQTGAQAPLRASEIHVDSLLRSPGPGWLSARSEHFIVYVERGPRADPARLLDSLEAAWTHAVTLLGGPVPEMPRVPVIVTASRTRFPRLLDPYAKGLATLESGGGRDIIVLVANDTVRAHTRHEVMHVVSRRAWGWRAPSWLLEGLATFADGRCQRTTLVAAGRDILQREPALTAEEVVERFDEMLRTGRGRAYLLAGTLVGSLWESRGRDGVRRLWQGTDTLRTTSASPLLRSDLTSEWRAHVKRAAGTTPGVPPDAFRRWACG